MILPAIFSDQILNQSVCAAAQTDWFYNIGLDIQLLDLKLSDFDWKMIHLCFIVC